jgi:hypothetical protein
MSSTSTEKRLDLSHLAGLDPMLQESVLLGWIRVGTGLWKSGQKIDHSLSGAPFMPAGARHIYCFFKGTPAP